VTRFQFWVELVLNVNIKRAFSNKRTTLIFFYSGVLLVFISIINGETDIPEECKSGNYKELIGPNHQHRHLGYRTSNKVLTERIHEGNEKYSVGFNNWFRFRLSVAERLLETTELPILIEDKNDVS